MLFLFPGRSVCGCRARTARRRPPLSSMLLRSSAPPLPSIDWSLAVFLSPQLQRAWTLRPAATPSPPTISLDASASFSSPSTAPPPPASPSAATPDPEPSCHAVGLLPQIHFTSSRSPAGCLASFWKRRAADQGRGHRVSCGGRWRRLLAGVLGEEEQRTRGRRASAGRRWRRCSRHRRQPEIHIFLLRLRVPHPCLARLRCGCDERLHHLHPEGPLYHRGALLRCHHGKIDYVLQLLKTIWQDHEYGHVVVVSDDLIQASGGKPHPSPKEAQVLNFRPSEPLTAGVARSPATNCSTQEPLCPWCCRCCCSPSCS